MTDLDESAFISEWKVDIETAYRIASSLFKGFLFLYFIYQLNIMVNVEQNYSIRERQCQGQIGLCSEIEASCAREAGFCWSVSARARFRSWSSRCCWERPAVFFFVYCKQI